MKKAIVFFLLLFPIHALSGQTFLYSGGVAGIETLMEPDSSLNFRKKGGGIFLHGVGWGRLSDQEKRALVKANHGAPYAIEMGFGNGEAHDKAWAARLKERYFDYGIVPDFILSNAYGKRNVPTPQRWKSFVTDFRTIGFKNPVYPTFEYANYQGKKDALAANSVSKRRDFQEIISDAGGISIDAPAGYFLYERDSSYKAWVVDAVRWTRGQGLQTVLIVSPHNSGKRFQRDAVKQLSYLKRAEAMPDIIVVENYKADPPSDYIPVVGRESMENTVLGVGWFLLNEYFAHGRQP